VRVRPELVVPEDARFVADDDAFFRDDEDEDFFREDDVDEDFFRDVDEEPAERERPPLEVLVFGRCPPC
jgi:hypothetical protein